MEYPQEIYSRTTVKMVTVSYSETSVKIYIFVQHHIYQKNTHEISGNQIPT